MLFNLIVIAAAVFIGYRLLRRFVIDGERCRSQARMDNKTVIITGANTGIGKETAKDLATRGARVILACRDMVKAERAATEIKDSTGNQQIVVRKLDLASLKSVREFAKTVLEEEDRLDVLLNNAGIMMCPHWETEDGFEMQFGTNHLGHFLLTNLLLNLLKKSSPSRIINVSSVAHKMARSGMDFDDLQCKKSYGPTVAYAKSKLANILFTQELANRLKGTGVTSYALHPGTVMSELQRNIVDAYPVMGLNKLLQPILNPIVTLFTMTPTQGAQTSIYCAVEESISDISGRYYSNCGEETPSKAAQNAEQARRLWDISVQLVGLDDKKDN